MRALVTVLYYALDLYKWAFIITAVMSWLVAFGVINVYNNAVRSIWDTLNAVTEPALRLVRRFLPNFNGIDISPIIVILAIWLIQMELVDFFLGVRF